MKFLLSFFFLAIGLSMSSQNDSLQFPDDFYGIYKGNLNIINARGNQTIGMEFHLNKTDSIGKHQYTLVYIMNGERQERRYNLIEKDVTKGEYIVDENNGVLLDAKLIDNTLYAIFEVQNSLITTTERFYADSMDFEITFTDIKLKTTTGTEGEDKFEVHSYPIGGVQKAHLLKD